MNNFIEIGSHKIGVSQPCFIIAEAGVNHNGDVGLAHKLVDIAAQAEADAVKFQTFKAETLANRQAPKAEYQLKTTNAIESQQEMLRRLELSPADHRQLMEYCKKKGILFLSTPFDEESADFLDEMDIAAFKIPSGEITNLQFLEHVARKRKPIILSTGMSYLGEVESAVGSILKTGNQKLVLLHCVSCYPAAASEVNLNAMRTLASAFNLPVGFSDHTTGIEISLAAVALGATIVEKHFTLDRNLPGPDHRASLEPKALSQLVTAIRRVESALGDGIKRPVDNELKNALVARKSIVAAYEIKADTELTENMMTLKRPGTGLPPQMRRYLIGRKAKHRIKEGALFKMEMLS